MTIDVDAARARRAASRSWSDEPQSHVTSSVAPRREDALHAPRARRRSRRRSGSRGAASTSPPERAQDRRVMIAARGDAVAVVVAEHATCARAAGPRARCAPPRPRDRPCASGGVRCASLGSRKRELAAPLRQAPPRQHVRDRDREPVRLGEQPARSAPAAPAARTAAGSSGHGRLDMDDCSDMEHKIPTRQRSPVD